MKQAQTQLASACSHQRASKTPTDGKVLPPSPSTHVRYPRRDGKDRIPTDGYLDRPDRRAKRPMAGGTDRLRRHAMRTKLALGLRTRRCSTGRAVARPSLDETGGRRRCCPRTWHAASGRVRTVPRSRQVPRRRFAGVHRSSPLLKQKTRAVSDTGAAAGPYTAVGQRAQPRDSPSPSPNLQEFVSSSLEKNKIKSQRMTVIGRPCPSRHSRPHDRHPAAYTSSGSASPIARARLPFTPSEPPVHSQSKRASRGTHLLHTYFPEPPSFSSKPSTNRRVPPSSGSPSLVIFRDEISCGGVRGRDRYEARETEMGANRGQGTASTSSSPGPFPTVGVTLSRPEEAEGRRPRKS